MGEINGQVIVTLNPHAGLVGVEAADGGDALRRSIKGALALVETDTDDNLVEQRQTAFDNAGMTDGKRVETAWENSDFLLDSDLL